MGERKRICLWWFVFKNSCFNKKKEKTNGNLFFAAQVKVNTSGASDFSSFIDPRAKKTMTNVKKKRLHEMCCSEVHL